MLSSSSGETRPRFGLTYLSLASLAAFTAPAEAQLHGQTFVVAIDVCGVGPAECGEVPSTWSQADFPGSAVFATPNRTPIGAAGADFDQIFSDQFFEGHFLIGNSGTDSIVGAAFNALSIGVLPDCVHQHVTAAGNISSNSTFLDRAALNGNPNAFLLVQERGDAYPTETIGAYYASPVPGKWAIFNQDGSTMTVGRRFWVLDGSCASVLAAELTVAACTPVGGFCYLQNPALLDGRPDAVVLVTQRWSSPASVYNPHPVGVRYDDALDRWAIFNEDGTAVPNDAGFFVGVVTVLFTDNFEIGFLWAWSDSVP
jgi:hypothetical protein